MNAIVWGRNITLEEDDVVYEQVGHIEEDEEGLGRLILTNQDEIKSLVASIDHIMNRGSITDSAMAGQPPQQQEQQNDSHLNTTINNLVDQFGDTGVEEGKFPQAQDIDYIPANASTNG